MGFYGKVTNTSKTSFTFDRTYPNRYTMDKYAKTDGVYVGRFVLIEYDSLPIDSCILTDGVGATYRLANVDEKTFDPAHKKYYILNDDGDYVYEPFWKYVPYKDGYSMEGEGGGIFNEEHYLAHYGDFFVRESEDSEVYYLSVDPYDKERTYFKREKATWTDIKDKGLILYTRELTYPADIFIEAYLADRKITSLDQVSYTFKPWLCNSSDAINFTSIKEGDVEVGDVIWIPAANNYFDYNNNLRAWFALYGHDSYDGIAAGDLSLEYKNGKAYIANSEGLDVTDSFRTGANAADEYKEYFKVYDKILIITGFKYTNQYDKPKDENGYYAKMTEGLFNKLKNDLYVKMENRQIIYEFASEKFDSKEQYYVLDQNTDLFKPVAVTKEEFDKNLAKEEEEKIQYYVKKDTYVGNYYRKVSENENFDSSFEYYIVVNVTDEVEYVESTTDNDYVINYNKDKEEYDSGRGYDSTVWQKVYSNGVERYVMIAELNSVVPTFDITIDAPTLRPIQPHFGSDSSNVYYKLHMQPQWGLRVKNASADKVYSDGVKMKSDVVVQDLYYEYDETTNTLSLKNGDPYSGAIYWNKRGFSIDEIHHDTGDSTIAIRPTGKSGALYNTHNGTNDKEQSEDIQEIAIQLPQIGDAIATVWDLVYGNSNDNPIEKNYEFRLVNLDRYSYEPGKYYIVKENIDYTPNYNNLFSNEMELSTSPIFYKGVDYYEKVNTRNTDIHWNSYNGLRMVKEDTNSNGFEYSKDRIELTPNNESARYTLNTQQVSTVAGAINSVHDLMGMVVTNVDEYVMNGTEIDPNFLKSIDDYHIYYHNGKYFRKHDYIEYDKSTEISGGEVPKDNIYEPVNPKLEKYEIGKYMYALPSGYTTNYNYVYELNEHATKDKPYYAAQDVINSFTPVTFPDGKYVKNKYFVKKGNDYIRDNEDYKLGESYYTIKHKRIYPYVPGAYYYRAKVNNLVSKNLSEIFNDTKRYYYLNRDEDKYYEIFHEDDRLFYITYNEYDEVVKHTITTDNNGVSLNNINENSFTFAAEEKAYHATLYGKDDANGNFTATKVASFNKNYSYYLIKGFQEGNEYYVYDEDIGDYIVVKDIVFSPDPVEVTDDLQVYEANTYFTIERANPDSAEIDNALNPIVKYTAAPLSSFELWKYFRQLKEGDNIKFEVPFVLSEYYELSLKVYNNFYKENSYYTYTGPIDFSTGLPITNAQINNGDGFYLSKEYNPKINWYYKRNNVKYKEHYFYVQDEYYVENDGEYEISRDEYEDNKDYLNRKPYYISYLDDKYKDIFKIGMEWNENIRIPEGIKVAKHKIIKKFQELYGFGRTMNTIHGLILRLNNMLEQGDERTRDIQTAQGCINQLNDIINKFASLRENAILTVDQFGRVNSSDYSGKQSDLKYTWYNNKIYTDRDNNRDNKPKENRWLKINVNNQCYKIKDSIKRYLPKIDTTTLYETYADAVDKILPYIVNLYGKTDHKIIYRIANDPSSTNYNNLQELYDDCIETVSKIPSRLDIIDPSISLEHNYNKVSDKTIYANTNIHKNDAKLYSKAQEGEVDQSNVSLYRVNQGTAENPVWVNLSQYDPSREYYLIEDDVAPNDATGSDNNSGRVEALKLYSPIIDSTGHVVGNVTEDVTLPYSYNRIHINANTSNKMTASSPSVNSTMTASEVYQQLNLASDDHWTTLRLEDNVLNSSDKFSKHNQTLYIGHAAPGTVANRYGQDANTDSANKPTVGYGHAFSSSYIEVDATGHVVGATATKTLTLPTISIDGKRTANSTNINGVLTKALLTANENELQLTSTNLLDIPLKGLIGGNDTTVLNSAWVGNSNGDGAIQKWYGHSGAASSETKILGSDTLGTIFGSGQSYNNNNNNIPKIYKIINEEIDHVVGNAPDTLNTLHEISNWIDKNADSVLSLQSNKYRTLAETERDIYGVNGSVLKDYPASTTIKYIQNWNNISYTPTTANTDLGTIHYNKYGAASLSTKTGSSISERLSNLESSWNAWVDTSSDMLTSVSRIKGEIDLISGWQENASSMSGVGYMRYWMSSTEYPPNPGYIWFDLNKGLTRVPLIIKKDGKNIISSTVQATINGSEYTIKTYKNVEYVWIAVNTWQA